MREIEGYVSLLGNSSVSSKGVTTYSVIKIGDKILQKIKIPTSLDSFLIVGERATIYIRKSIILGVKREDGIIYCYSARPFMAVFLILCGIPTLLVFGVGILFMWMGWAEILNYQFVAELKNKGAIEISM